MIGINARCYLNLIHNDIICYVASRHYSILVHIMPWPLLQKNYGKKMNLSQCHIPVVFDNKRLRFILFSFFVYKQRFLPSVDDVWHLEFFPCPFLYSQNIKANLYGMLREIELQLSSLLQVIKAFITLWVSLLFL